MRKPLIGITCNSLPAEGNIMPGMTRNLVNTDYISSVELAGGVPLLLPLISGYDSVLSQVAAVDGLILTGGPDIDPLLYGEEPLAQIGTVNHERDRYELLVIQAADELAKPVLGICRGIQMLNVAAGGTLHQEVALIEGCKLSHFQTAAQRNILWHSVNIAPASRIAGIVGVGRQMTNSFHHQSVKAVAPGFAATAHSQDGVIEAIERPGNRFVVGVQWHPELLSASTPAMLALFRALAEQAGQESGKHLR